MTKQEDVPTWKRMSFKGNKVWVQTGDTGEILVRNGRVRIKYNLKQDYEYMVHPENLKPEDQAVPSKSKNRTGKKSVEKTAARSGSFKKKNRAAETDLPDNCIKIYTDGASSGNPGPAGIGALLIFGENRKEISEFIGTGTNNIAELTAIQRALETLKRRDMPVRIFSDSSYAIGLLTQGWKPRKNRDLVEKIKALMLQFRDLAFIKVKGHAGIKENEVADYLATSAIKKGLK